jgi:hypothetical protein
MCHVSRVAAAAGVAATVAVAGCGRLVDSHNCTASVEPAVVVEIRDARTGAPLAAGAEGVVRDGAFVDVLRPAEASGPDSTSLYSRRAADERPGTYAIEVRRAGYQTWTASGVRVERGTCHVQTRRVLAALVPLG